MDPFSFQKAKIQEKKRLEEEAKRKAEIKIDKHENLELEDKNTEGINKSIDEMEKARKDKALRDARIDHALDAIDSVMPIEGDILPQQRPKAKLQLDQLGQVEQNEQNEQNSQRGQANSSNQAGRFAEFSQPENAEQSVRISAKNESAASPETDENASKHTRKKGKLRIAKTQYVDPWTEEEKPHRQLNLTPVDENKVAVGEVHVKDGDKVTPWGENAQLGKIEREEDKKPKRKYNRKPKQEQADLQAESAENGEKTEGIESNVHASDAVGNAENNALDTEKNAENSALYAGENTRNRAIDTDENATVQSEIRPKSELRINIGTKIEDTQGMGISFKKADKVMPWGDGANLGKFEQEGQKPKRKYTRKAKKVEETDEKSSETAQIAPESVKEQNDDDKSNNESDISNIDVAEGKKDIENVNASGVRV